MSLKGEITVNVKGILITSTKSLLVKAAPAMATDRLDESSRHDKGKSFVHKNFTANKLTKCLQK